MMTYEDIRRLCTQRRSARYFSDTPLTKEEIRSLLELAVLSPSVQNTQPWHFHIILDPKIRSKLTESYCYGNFVEGAGAFIVVSSERSVVQETGATLWNPRELEYSCASAIQNILLGATAMGLGSCWVSLLHGKVTDLLHVPHDHNIIGGIMLGHLKKGEEPTDGHKGRKPLEEVCTWYE